MGNTSARHARHAREDRLANLRVLAQRTDTMPSCWRALQAQPDVRAALAAYEALRRPRTSQLQLASRVQGEDLLATRSGQAEAGIIEARCSHPDAAGRRERPRDPRAAVAAPGAILPGIVRGRLEQAEREPGLSRPGDGDIVADRRVRVGMHAARLDRGLRRRRRLNGAGRKTDDRRSRP